LASRGRIVFSPAKGIHRQIESPVSLELVITPQDILQRGADQKWKRIPAGRHPEARMMIESFLSIFSGDTGRWTAEFDLFFEGTPEKWSLGLAPRKGRPAARRLRRITARGAGPALTALVVEETSGARTETAFGAPKLLPAVPQDEAAKLFPTLAPEKELP
jgi:hypothetical protein